MCGAAGRAQTRMLSVQQAGFRATHEPNLALRKAQFEGDLSRQLEMREDALRTVQLRRGEAAVEAIKTDKTQDEVMEEWRQAATRKDLFGMRVSRANRKAELQAQRQIQQALLLEQRKSLDPKQAHQSKALNPYLRTEFKHESLWVMQNAEGVETKVDTPKAAAAPAAGSSSSSSSSSASGAATATSSARRRRDALLPVDDDDDADESATHDDAAGAEAKAAVALPPASNHVSLSKYLAARKAKVVTG
jgi:hypothetical protein